MKFQANQMSLVVAILDELNRQAEEQGCKHVGIEGFQMNAITEGATAIVEGFNRTKKDSVAGMGLDAWIASDDTGTSSKTMAATMFPNKAYLIARDGGSHPWDPDDFGRCHRFLEAVPGAREKLSMMKSLSPVWARLVDRWDELTAAYLEELPSGSCPKLYASMRQLIEA